MDIKDILDSLGLDLTNPDAKRGALEAIEAILDSRKPPENLGSLGSAGSGASGSAEEVEIDPDLLRPSQKHQAPVDSTDDIEIEDEENILDQIKHNESEDSFDNNAPGDEDSASASSSSGSSDTSDDTSDDSDDLGSEDTDEETTDEAGSPVEKTPKESEAEGSEDEGTEDSNETSTSTPGENTESEEGEASEASETGDETGEVTADDFSDEVADEEEETPLDDEDADFDESDFLDDTLQNTYEDEGIKAKHHARKIKRERTLQAAKTALAAAVAKKASPALIRNLEKTVAALEALTEAVQKSLKDISEEEFNLLINNVLDAIDALGDSGLTYKTDAERELQAKEIKADLASTKTQQELSAEDIAQIRAETQAVQAREKEANKYKARSRSSFKGFQEFLNSLYRAVALQVSIEDVKDDTWSAINRRHSGSGVLQPGKRINELPNKKIPVIDFYFDQSGSWTERDVSVGEKAVNKLVEMEEAGDIKINIFYFSNHVFTEASDARAEGGTRAWNEIVKNVIATNATNVVIMTDSDMENWWTGEKALSYTVPGYVWYLWRDGENAPRLPRDLKGRGGTQQFSFSAGDA